MDRPKPRQVVQMLMDPKPDIMKDKRSTRGVARKDVIHHVYVCPRKNLCKVGGDVVFEKDTGFSNPYKHLKVCLCDGDEERLLQLFRHRREEKRRFGQCKDIVLSTTRKEQAMYGYLRLIIMKSLPLSYVTDSVVRSFSKFDVKFGVKYTKAVISKLTMLVERRIARLMNQTQGSILHDGWSHNGMHYFGVFASFMRKVPIVRNGVECDVEELCLVLISVSPLSKEVVDGNVSEDEAERFDADAHLRHLKEIFAFYDQDVYNWVLCSIADNAPVNKRLASLLGVPHVGCMSHKLNLEVKKMVKNDKDLATTVESIHETMSNCRRRLTNRAMIRNLTELSPLIPNETRWSGMYQMLKRFVRIHDELLKVADKDGATVTIDRSSAFETRAKKFSEMLSQIDTVTLELQKRGVLLSHCRYAVDLLLDAVNDGRTDSLSDLHGCHLGKTYVATDSEIVTDPHFESGVIKIQNQNESALSDFEKDACWRLRAPSISSRGASSSTRATIAEKLAKGKRRCLEFESSYRNCSFIIGSVAEVERLWSIAKYILTENRGAMTPEVFESLIFLKVNSEFWDLTTVSEAIRSIRNDGVPSATVEVNADEN